MHTERLLANEINYYDFKYLKWFVKLRLIIYIRYSSSRFGKQHHHCEKAVAIWENFERGSGLPSPSTVLRHLGVDVQHFNRVGGYKGFTLGSWKTLILNQNPDVIGYHGIASLDVASLSCGLYLWVKVSRNGWPPKEITFIVLGTRAILQPLHTNRMIYVAHIHLVPPCNNVYVFK